MWTKKADEIVEDVNGRLPEVIEKLKSIAERLEQGSLKKSELDDMGGDLDGIITVLLNLNA